MEWNEFVENVQRWAAERGIYEHSTALMQLYKSVSEYGELVDGLAKQDKMGTKDGIGDVAVTLVNVATMLNVNLSAMQLELEGRTSRLIHSLHASLGRLLDEATELGSPNAATLDSALHSSIYALRGIANNEGLSFGRCLQVAWDAIKDRKGRMVEGGVFVKDEASAEQRLAELKAEIAELEDQLEAIGAGGVTRGQKLIRNKRGGK